MLWHFLLILPDVLRAKYIDAHQVANQETMSAADKTKRMLETTLPGCVFI